MVESPRLHEVLEAEGSGEIVPFVAFGTDGDGHAQGFLADALELVERIAVLAGEAEVVVVAGGALRRTQHWQVDSAFQEIALRLFLASVLGAAAGTSFHAPGAGKVRLEVIARQALAALVLVLVVAALAVLPAAVEALAGGEGLRFGADEAGRRRGAVYQRAVGHAICWFVPIGAGNAADLAVDHFEVSAARDLLFEAGGVVLEVAWHALEAEFFLHAALAVSRASFASAVGQVVSLEAGEAG